MAAARAPMLLALQDTHWPFEIFAGNVAAALRDGLELDVSRLWIIPHVRGGPLFGLLAAPLYGLFGESEVVLKLVPLLWHAATVAFVTAAAERLFDRRAAWCALAVGLCAPPLLAKLAVIGFATHDESALVAAAALWVAAPLATDERSSAGRWAALGALFGFAGFFHLQALLAMAWLVFLLFVSRPKATLRGAPAFVLAAAALAAPSWLFDGGNVELLRIQAGSGTRVSPLQATPAPDGEVTLYGVPAKARAALTEGLAPVLEFGDIGPGRRVLARLWWWSAVAAAVAALWAWRQALLARPFMRAEGPAFLIAYPAGLAVLLTLAWVVSGMEMQQWYAAAALESRRGALALWGVVMLVPAAGSARCGRLGLVPVAVLCAVGLVGQFDIADGRAERAGPNRGESYEQFAVQLEHHAGRDPAALLATLDEVDRGDMAFVTLRFRLPSQIARADKPLQEAVAWARRGDDQRLRLLRLTHAGRVIGEAQDRDAHQELVTASWFAGLPWLERVALLHGAGLGAAARRARPSQRPNLEGPPPFMRWYAFGLPPVEAGLLFEGVGFKIGAEHDPYLRLFRLELMGFDELPDRLAESFYRGVGWGLRQRFVSPPTEAPADARVLADVPERRRDAFLDGLLGRVLPPEAQALAGS